MKRELHYFDIYPKTVEENTEVKLTIRPLGSHVNFTEGKKYNVSIIPMTETIYDLDGQQYETIVVSARNNQLEFSSIFKGEQEFTVRI